MDRALSFTTILPTFHGSTARRAVLIFALACHVALGAAPEAQWIWSPEHEKEKVPQVACHFRKAINLRSPDAGRIVIVADDQYELYVNGRRLGVGQSTEKMVEYDIAPLLTRGKNLIAIKVSNVKGRTAAVAARVLIKEHGDEWRSFSTDDTWKTNLQPLPLWNSMLYNDVRWSTAQSFGQLGETPPWDVREVAAVEKNEQPSTQRFKIADQFEVRELLDGEKTGSLIAMTFNEFGHILASREGGPLLLIHDEDKDGSPETVQTYCDKVKNCQGILALNGEVFVTAEGPAGIGLYRLADKDHDGQLEDVQQLVKFPGPGGEHGPHAVTLGPDGLIYVVVGNHSLLPENLAETSPYSNWYEGDLVQPRYEDPTGHAAGVKAPGGYVLRTDIDGAHVEIVAGGLRNAYDLAFNREGDIFIHDSDMESDLGTNWYRPTRLFHVTPGAEVGWRSGWSTWPEYLVDVVPGVLDTGRGSPTGATFYSHFAFPTRYHDVLFLADWSEGRILAVDIKRNGASYTASSEVFLQGQPLNVTDLDVGPDGGLYFCTGGRGTAGGVYRIKWRGDIPATVANLGEGVGAAIRQPQINSAWSRQKIASIKQTLEQEDKWSKQIAGVAKSTANPWYYRVRSLQIMQLYGPAPSTDLLIRLAKDENEVVRAKAAELMGLHTDERTHDQLVTLLDDGDRLVRRRACEALLRAGQAAPFDKLIPCLTSDDRLEVLAARRLLEQTPTEEWRNAVLEGKDHRLFITGGLALLIAQPTEENAIAVLTRFDHLLDDFISDRNFVDMLRLAQVALHRSGVKPEEVQSLAQKLGDEFPSADAVMNRELMRLLAYLQVTSPLERYLAYLTSDAADIDKLHVALHLRFLNQGWPEGKRLDVIKYFEDTKKRDGVGKSFQSYLALVERDFARSLTPEEGREVLANGKLWPAAATGALYGLPTQLDDLTLTSLTELDQQLATSTDEATVTLRTGIVAVLARSGDDRAFAYLRQLWENEPERRDKVTLGLAQKPGDENWEFLVRSLPVLETNAAVEVLTRLRTVQKNTDDPEHIRQVILRGIKLQENGIKPVIALLQHWTGQELLDEQAPWQEQLKAWQDWYADEYPDRPKAELPVASTESKWKFDELFVHLTSDAGGRGSIPKGAVAFEKALCAKCHRHGQLGDAIGPELTSLSKRFRKREVLESIVFPSHVISDQYASKTVLTTSGKAYTGLVAAGSPGETIVLQNNGKKVTVSESDIDQIIPSQKSVMPDNLLDQLSLEEVSDLFAFLGVVPSAENIARRQPGDTGTTK